MEQLQAIFELDKKNGQIVELERQNELKALTIKQQRISQLIMVIGILAALFFSLSIYWFYHKIRHKNIELKESNAAKDKFFAVIAHDLRGPAGNLASFLEYLKDSYNEHSPTELKKILLTLHTSAENVTVLLENLLIWAQSQLNKIEFKPAELNLSEVIQHATKGLRQSAENKEIKIKLDLDDHISVLADQNMVQTIVRNLCSNTIKFSNRGRSVVIQSGLLNRQTAYVRISDKGIGIEKTFLSNIFNIGNTLHTPGTENEKSTGLGLILVKEFVEKNRGTISIESEKDKGTIVTFTLPANNTSS
jgi:signal transduction histidine kinase